METSANFLISPQVFVQTTSTPIEATPIAGQNCTITHHILGADNLNSTLTYKWTKNNGSKILFIPTTSNTLAFSPVNVSDAGNCNCEFTISSRYLVESRVVVNDSRHLQVKGKTLKSQCNPFIHSFVHVYFQFQLW